MRTRLTIILVYFSLISFGQQDDDLTKKGLKYGKSGNFSKAIEYFDKALGIE